ncbi:MAG: hemerythrin domain-containing protein [Bacteroidetes bacterium]|nr:hemerythrin domain-containing protein [Bacteroidota bacterium]MBU2585882.1 hemerythrin domain-containing protein [Bacteroidota bacterium]
MIPTDILKQEHRALERMLNVLESALQKAEKGEQVSSQVFSDIIEFIKMFGDKCHHGKEEDLLFPAMETKGFSKEMGPVAVMLSEHTQGRQLVAAMTKAADRYSESDQSALADLAFSGRNFMNLLRQHIQKEDNILFVMADQHFNEVEQNELLVKFQKVEKENEACSLKSKFISTLESLEKEFIP